MSANNKEGKAALAEDHRATKKIGNLQTENLITIWIFKIKPGGTG